MVKIIGAITIGASCACLGFRMSRSLGVRARSLADIGASLELLESEISFSESRLKNAFERVDRNGLFKAAADGLDSKGTQKAWHDAVESARTRLCLTDADCGALIMLGAKLGKTDTEDQLKHIKYVKTLIAEQERQAQNDYEKLGKLYGNGGVLVGLMLIIMLI